MAIIGVTIALLCHLKHVILGPGELLQRRRQLDTMSGGALYLATNGGVDATREAIHAQFTTNPFLGKVECKEHVLDSFQSGSLRHILPELLWKVVVINEALQRSLTERLVQAVHGSTPCQQLTPSELPIVAGGFIHFNDNLWRFLLIGAVIDKKTVC